LITDKKSLNGVKLVKDNLNETFANKFIYSKDSLRNIETGELYYINVKRKNKFDQFYLIIDKKPIKLENKRQAIRFVKKLDPKNELKLMNRDSARIKYGIDRKYPTYRVNE
jgi:hypothetical protein